MTFDSVHRLAPGAERGDNVHVRLGVDPTPQQTAGDSRIVDHHHPDGSVGRGRRIFGGNCNTHGTLTSSVEFSGQSNLRRAELMRLESSARGVRGPRLA
jgi:hypothetical protein